MESHPIANPGDWHMAKDRRSRGYGYRLYHLSAGAYASEHVYVWADSFESALETAAEHWLATAPGLFSEPDYVDSARELGLTWDPTSDDWDDDSDNAKIREHAETDHTYTESGWLLSWEWTGREVTDPLEWYAIRMRSDEELTGEDYRA